MSARCPTLPIAPEALAKFEAADARFPGKGFAPREVRALDGSGCGAITVDGVTTGATGRCVDLGIATSDKDTASSEHMLSVLPARPVPYQPALTALATKLQARLHAGQFAASYGFAGAPSWRAIYYVNTVPHVGFGSVIEYVMLFLARSTHLGSQLVLGKSSSTAWTSAWACKGERSLNCYFNLSSCCAVLQMDGRPLELPRRRNPLSIGLPGFNGFGSAWVSGQLAHFYFSRMNPTTRARVDARRAPLLARGASHPPTIGMHIRGGDSCHAHRYCPSNLTSTYFAQAAILRERYGVNRILLATDSAAAAALCAAGVMRFECRTMQLQRAKFDSATFIENRIGREGDDEAAELSGATVALDVLADIDMLADCDFHVLLFRSAVSRLAYSLSMARKGRPTPLVSMQWPWSPRKLKEKFLRATAKGRGQPRSAPREKSKMMRDEASWKRRYGAVEGAARLRALELRDTRIRTYGSI